MNQEIRPGLTNMGQSPHNGERTIFMADDQGQELPPSQAPKAPVLPQPQRGIPGTTTVEPPPTEKKSQPDTETIEAARKVWERVAQKRGKPLSEKEKALMGQGKGPIGGGAASADHFTKILGQPEGSPEEADAIAKYMRRHEHRERGDRHEFSPEDLEANPEVEERVARYLSETLAGGEHLQEEIWQLLAKYDVYAENFISRIIFDPYKRPTVDYDLRHLGWYTETNLHNLIHYLGVRHQREYERETRGGAAHSGRWNPEIEHRYNQLMEAVASYHRMNLIINAGNLDKYAEITAFFSPEFFEITKEEKGVASAKMLYEMAYRTILNRDGLIDSRNIEEVRRLVKEWLGEERLDDRQLEKADYLADRMFSSEFRAAENMSIGGIPSVEGYMSYPQESARRILDWFRNIGFRFTPDQVKGGLWLIHKTKERFMTQLDRKYPFLGKVSGLPTTNTLKTVDGLDAGDMQLASIFGISGVWSGYRLEVGVLHQIRSATDPEKSILEVLKKLDLGKEAKERVRSVGDLQRLNQRIDNELAPLVNGHSIALGALLSSGSLSHPLLYHAREIIWKRAVELNPLVAASMLTKLDFSDSMNRPMDGMNLSLEGVLLNVYGEMSDDWQGMKAEWDELRAIRENFWDRLTDKDKQSWDENRNSLVERILETGEWKNLQTLLVKAHLKRMRKGEGVDYDETTKVVTDQQKALYPYLTEFGADADQRAIIQQVIANGQAIAKNLALLRFPNTVFLDDIPFQYVNYRDLGAQFFSRRMGSDLPSVAASQRAWGEVIANWTSAEPDKLLEHFAEAVKGLSTPHGRDGAQDRVDPFYDAYLEGIEGKTAYRHFLVNALGHSLHRPKSVAQEYGSAGGPNPSPALNAQDMSDLIDKGLNMGIDRKNGRGKREFVGEDGTVYASWEENWDDTYKKRKRKHRAALRNKILEMIINLGTGYIIALPFATAKKMGPSKS